MFVVLFVCMCGQCGGLLLVHCGHAICSACVCPIACVCLSHVWSMRCDVDDCVAELSTGGLSLAGRCAIAPGTMHCTMSLCVCSRRNCDCYTLASIMLVGPNAFDCFCKPFARQIACPLQRLSGSTWLHFTVCGARRQHVDSLRRAVHPPWFVARNAGPCRGLLGCCNLLLQLCNCVQI